MNVLAIDSTGSEIQVTSDFSTPQCTELRYVELRPRGHFHPGVATARILPPFRVPEDLVCNNRILNDRLLKIFTTLRE